MVAKLDLLLWPNSSPAVTTLPAADAAKSTSLSSKRRYQKEEEVVDCADGGVEKNIYKDMMVQLNQIVEELAQEQPEKLKKSNSKKKLEELNKKSDRRSIMAILLSTSIRILLCMSIAFLISKQFIMPSFS